MFFSGGLWHIPIPAVMGILNVTPDSFSDGGRYISTQSAVAHALEMQEQGADIIDIGGQSTRPGAKLLSVQEEISRLAPVLESLKGRLNIPLSVDTFYPAVAGFALENGATIINDVSGFISGSMAQLILKHNAGWIIMHNPGGQKGASAKIQYQSGVIQAVYDFFENALKLAQHFGVNPNAICFDPGFGFGKNKEAHIELLNNLKMLKKLGRPLLAGISRKRFVRELLEKGNGNGLDELSAELHALAVKNGADIVRTHEVELTRKVLEKL